MKKIFIDTEVKKIVYSLKKYPGVMAIVLFGSSVTGKVKPLSDIDLAVIMKEHDKRLEAEIFGFSSPKIDVVNFHRLPLFIQFDVFKHGKPIFIRNKERFFEIQRNVLREYLEMSYLYDKMTRSILT